MCFGASFPFHGRPIVQKAIMTDLHPTAANVAQAHGVTPDQSRRNVQVIVLLLICTFTTMLNETAMNVAIPRLMAAFDVTAGAAQWLTTAFLLTMAVVIPVTGFLIQRINTRPLFLIAMSTFATGTFICAVAPGLEVLIAGRVVQAMGSAIMMPLQMTTVMTLVPPEKRGKIMGNISIVISVAPALGPSLSGFILEHLQWRWLFILVLPIALLAVALGSRFMRNVTEQRYAPLDGLSVVLSALAFGGIVNGLSGLGGEGATQIFGLPSWVSLVVGVVAMVIFVLRQLSLQQQDRALLDLRIFQSKLYAICLGVLVISMAVLLGIIILLPIYVQNVLGVGVLHAGLLLMPGGMLMGLMAPVVGRLYDRFGPRPLVVPGTMLVSLVFWGLTFVGQTTSVWILMVGHLVLCFGSALVFTPLYASGLGSVPPKLYSHASAMTGSAQQLAGAMGVALFVAVLSLQQRAAASAGMDAMSALTSGIRGAFLCGAILYMLAVVGAWFVQRPADALQARETAAP